MSGVLQVIHCMVRLWSGQFKAQNNILWLRLFCIMLLLGMVHASVWCIFLIVPMQCSNHCIFLSVAFTAPLSKNMWVLNSTVQCSCPAWDFTYPKNLDAEFIKPPHGACQLTGWYRRQNTTIAVIIDITVITSVTSVQLVWFVSFVTVLFGSKYWQHSIHTIICDSSEFLKWMTIN